MNTLIQEQIQNKKFMNYNSHKRLVNYLSQPKQGFRHNSSDHAYLESVKSKYITNDKPINLGTTNFYNVPKGQPVMYCPQCNEEKAYVSKACVHRRSQQRGIPNARINSENPTNQYYEMEIKTIKNTLLDIRDQMKNRTKSKQFTKYPHQVEDQRRNSQQQMYIRVKQIQTKRKLQEQEKINIQLHAQVDTLNNVIVDLERKNRLLQTDKDSLQAKIYQHERQAQEQRNRCNRIEAEKIKCDERLRTLEIKIMDLRAQIMQKQQLLRDLNLEGQQQKHMQATRRMMMGPSDQVSVLVSGRSRFKQTRGAQTNLTQVDIESGYRQLNKMQDTLCDKINGNLKVQKKIFAHIEDLDNKLSFAYDRIYKVQQEAVKMGIIIQI